MTTGNVGKEQPASTIRGPARADAAERLARALLSRVTEPGDRELAALLTRYTAAEIVRDLRRDRLPVTNARHWRTRLSTARPEADLHAVERLGGRFVVPGDQEWPAQLDDLGRVPGEYSVPPVGLWLRGAGKLADADRTIAVVGSRAATGYGEYVAAEFALGLVERGFLVVSGGAYGIDAAAHRGALAGGGATVAVLACGVDVCYPRGNATLFHRILSTGLLLSEWPPGCAPMRHRFLVRNRVIAALASGTIVVEAAARSGALNTANRARELGRHVMAVPGPVTSPLSAGSNQLLREPDVFCITRADDVVEIVGRLDLSMAPMPGAPPSSTLDRLDGVTRRVLDAVPARRSAGPAGIALAAGLALPDVLAALGRLAADGLVERTDAGWRVAG